MIPVDHNARPWLGLDSYGEDTQGVFYGRDDETAELGRRVERKLLTVLFGQSGLGKTSILRAGIVPRLRPQGYCPIYLRLDHSPGSPPPAEQIKAEVIRATQAVGTWSKAGAARPGESLWEFFHHRDDVLTDASGRVLTPLLIFDQFEEIFTLAQTDDAGRARAREFLRDLANLVENRAPLSIEDDEDAAASFDFARADYRLLIALREDYLAHLESLRDVMPSVTQNRVRLTRMAGGPALEVVVRPGAGLVSDEVARQIVRFVSGASDLATAEVEPSLLSLVCRELNEMRIAQGRAEISAGLLEGSRETILNEFYERSLADQPAAVRHFVEDVLLTDSGFRESVAEERVRKACANAGAPDALAVLIDRRLLRIEERLDVRRVELTHDVLCGVVKASRETRQEREAKERAERDLAATREREAATRRSMWRARILGLGAAILCVFAVASAYFGYRNMVRAREEERAARTIAYSSAMMVARQVLDDGNLGRTKTILNEQRPKPGEPDLRGWEWRYLWGQTRSDAASTLYQDPTGGEISSLAISPDGRLLAIGALHLGGVVVKDLATRETIATLAPNRRLVQVAFSPTAPLLALSSLNADNSDAQVELWNLQTRERLRAWPLGGACIGLAFAADGRSLLSSTAGDPQGGIATWNTSDGSRVAAFSAPQPNLAVGTGFAATTDLGLAVYCSGKKGSEITVVDAHTGAVRWTAPLEQPFFTAAAFSPDGSLLATAEGFGATDIRLWQADSGELIGRLHGHQSWVAQIVFWPDGSKLATAAADQTIRVWDLKSRAALHVLRGHENEVWRLALMPDGHTLVSGSKDGVVALWDTSDQHRRGSRIDGPRPLLDATWSADGGSVITLDRDGRVERWSGPDLDEVKPIAERKVGGLAGAFSRDGRIGVEQEAENQLVVWDPSDGSIRARLAVPQPGERVDSVFSRRNRVLLHQPEKGLFQEINLATGEVVQSWTAPVGADFRTSSVDERLYFYLAAENEVVIRDLDARTTREVKVDFLEPGGCAVSPDGSRFAVASRIGYVRVWDTASWREVITLRGFMNGSGGVAFSPDGRRLVAGDSSSSQAMRFFDTASWQEVLTLKAPGSAFSFQSFSPDGNRVAAFSADYILHVWTAPSWDEIRRAEQRASR